MTIHYHGTPITPRHILELLAGHPFCVSFAHPRDVETCHRIGQSVTMLEAIETKMKEEK